MNRSKLLEAIRAEVLTALQSGPQDTYQLAALAKVPTKYMQVLLHREKEAGRVSSVRAKSPNAPSVYYIGDTAPKPEPKPEVKRKAKVAHRIPVQTVIVRPFSIAGDDGTAFKITMPAAPWEVRV